MKQIPKIPLKKINNDITITISNGDKFVSLIKWKEKRLLETTKLRLGYLDEYWIFLDILYGAWNNNANDVQL